LPELHVFLCMREVTTIEVPDPIALRAERPALIYSISGVAHGASGMSAAAASLALSLASNLVIEVPQLHK
jgi:hypothetical protein